MKITPTPRSRRANLTVILSVLAGSSFVYDAALAQSTGSQAVDEVIVVAKKQTTLQGVMTTQEAPKTRSVITQQYLATQPPGQSVLQSLNLVPGVNFTNNDPFGSSGGDIRIHGFDGSRIALLVDGVPLNDTGNYAIYSNQQLDPEIIAETNVNVGSTDADSPTASATGGLININSATPTREFAAFANVSGGGDSYRRVAAMINTGEIGPWGTRAWGELSYQKYNKFKGPGTLQKKQGNFKIYQPLIREGDFIAVAGHYNENRNNSYYGLNLPSAGSKGDAWNTDYSRTYNPSASNYYGYKINPSNTGNLRGESRFTLAPNVHLTVDPAYQFVMANGGGSTTIKESDARLVGASTTAGCPGKQGVDLNGDGNCTDTVRVYAPSNTSTNRYSVNASLLWDLNAKNLVRLAYAFDYGRHRQTGEYSLLDANGNPTNVFGGKDGYGSKIYAADGSFLDGRNRLSIAKLNQFSLEYVGRFVDDKLRIDAGLRDPHFERNLHQYCYTSASNGSSVYCDSATAPAPYTIAPYTAHVSYTKLLPNVGLAWHFDGVNQIYFNYADELSAPRTDDLYTVKVTSSNTANILSVQPETARLLDFGYRYQTPRLQGAVSIWSSHYANRIVSSYDQASGENFDRNVGTVQLHGVDAQVGANPLDRLTLVGTVSYAHSAYQSNLVVGGKTLATKGKQLVETPEWMSSARAVYQLADFDLGLQGKYVGRRFATDVNDVSVGGYTTWDADVRYKLDAIRKGLYVQVNVINIFDKHYYGSIGSSNNAAGGPYAYQGSPRTFWATLHVAL